MQIKLLFQLYGSELTCKETFRCDKSQPACNAGPAYPEALQQCLRGTLSRAACKELTINFFHFSLARA